MNRSATLFLILAMLAVIVACSSGGGSHDESSLTSMAPTVDADCVVPGAATCPSAVDCRPYLNPEQRPISIDARWQEKLNLCCGLRLCVVAGECRFGCPPDLINPRCPGAR
jgi:hypothetical protein